MKSKFEHSNFIGYTVSRQLLEINPLIGSSKETLLASLDSFALAILQTGPFYLTPLEKAEHFLIMGDCQLAHRHKAAKATASSASASKTTSTLANSCWKCPAT